MKSFRTTIISGILLAFLLLAAFIYHSYKTSHRPLPYYTYNAALNKIIVSPEEGARIGDFSFINQEGKYITQKDIGETIYVADYFFVECPGICKKMSSQLQRVYKEFEHTPGVKIISHTSKPDHDSSEVLMNYAAMYGVTDNNKWIFLTGNKQKLYAMARQQYFIVNDEGDGGEEDFIHTERFVLIDKNKYIRGYYDGTNEAEVGKLITDIHVLINE